MKEMKKLNEVAGVLILLGILMAANVVLGPVRLRKDMTEEKLYTLSDGTRQLLRELDRGVTMKFYFSKSNDQVPVPLKNFANRIRDLLKEYESLSGGHLALEEYDPKPDSDAEEWANRYGLAMLPLDTFSDESNLYLGLVAVSGNREAVMPVILPDSEPQLEYDLTRMVAEVVAEKDVKVGIMSALPVMGATPNPMLAGQGRPWAFVSEIQRQYEVAAVDLETERIPDGIDTLVVVHPAGIPESALYAIDQFVLRGGRLLAFTDPLCLTAQETADPQMAQLGIQPETSSDLNMLTAAWAGIGMPLGLVACDEAASTMIDSGQGRAIRNAAFLSLMEDNVNQGDVATASIGNLMLPFSGAYTGSPTNGVAMTELLHTARDGFLTSTAAARYGQVQIATETRRLPLAVRLQGSFKTAFPDGKPSSDEAVADENQLMESIGPGVVVLVADVDMVYDRFSMQSYNLMGQVVAQPINENLGFALNMLEQLCGSDVLIGLRSRGSYARPFDRVLELQTEAALRWQPEEDRLNQKYQELQQQLIALRQATNDGLQLAMTPQQEAEVKSKREEIFQINQSLKEVRKNLRRDIELLGARLKALNILAVPLLVAAYGIARGIWIRRTR